jgi:hypothetical protein
MANDQKSPKSTVSLGSGGKVQVDERGRNVWQWEDSQLDSTSILLRRLDNAILELEPTRSVPIPAAANLASSSRDTSGHRDAQTGDEKKPGRRASKTGSAQQLSIESTMTVPTPRGFDPYNRS